LRLIYVWLALSAITLAQLGVGAQAPGPSAAISSGAIVVALFKVRLILREFMEVRRAPVLLGRLTDLWIGLAGVSLLGCYFAGLAR
jgi:hypothetical protein